MLYEKLITLRVIEGFLRWYISTHSMAYQSGFLIFEQYFRSLWCEEMSSLFNLKLRRKMTMASPVLANKDVKYRPGTHPTSVLTYSKA